MTIKGLINEAKCKFENSKLTYDEISEITGISRSVLNRMFNGKFCPKSSESKTVKCLARYVGNLDAIDEDTETIFDAIVLEDTKREMFLCRLSKMETMVNAMAQELKDIRHFIEEEL